MRPLKTITGTVASLYIGEVIEAYQGYGSKTSVTSVRAELDGLIGDRHRGFTRTTFSGDKEPEGTVRRNERQWSAMSVEEIAIIQKNMDLNESLQGSDLAVNICVEGIPDFSQLSKGSKFTFPSGAKLVVVEYNPPCAGMGEVLAKKYTQKSGAPLTRTSFPVAAIGLRGLVGVVDVAGDINVGDKVVVEIWNENCQMNKPRK